MSSRTFRAGVAAVQIPLDSSTALPSLQTLTFSACGAAYTTFDNNDVKSNLDTSATYQVILGLIGRDLTNGGYTIGYCSPSSGNLTISSGQGILISVVNSDWPANIGKGVAVAVFLKTGSGDFKLAEYAYLDADVDFKHMVVAKPHTAAITKSSAILRSTTADTELGDRAPYGYDWRTLSPTSGGVKITRNVDSVEFRPDTAQNFNGKTTSTAAISFELMSNDIRDVVAGNSGNYVKFSSGGTSYESAQLSLYSAAVKFLGNRPLRLVMPTNQQGFAETRLYLGQNLQNQEGNEENWVKDDQITVAYSYSPAPFDTLLDNMHTEIHYRKNG